jgi:SAM-dependent methyltransferase
MSTLSDRVTSYDEVPYISRPYAMSHPDRLAAISTLFGLSPPTLETGRVLEIGCSFGNNIIPMAEVLPKAKFLGIDLSDREIAKAIVKDIAGLDCGIQIEQLLPACIHYCTRSIIYFNLIIRAYRNFTQDQLKISAVPEIEQIE